MDLEPIHRTLADSAPQAKEPAKGHEASLKELKSDITWLAIRGIVTILISAPFSLLLIISTGASGSIITLVSSIVFLWAVVLGIRDLSKAYSILRNPETALAEIKSKKEGSPFDNKRLPLSVTEHTTSLLESPPKKLDTSAIEGSD
jgi:hypothetical protein